MRIAFLFPGQGAQTPGFLHRLPQHDVVLATLEQASRELQRDWSSLDQESSLASTIAVQLGTVIAGVAQARLLAAHDVYPDAVAGLSVGAFAAAVTCGALDFADALALVRLRASSMEEMFGGAGFGMVAVIGLGERDVRAIVETIAPDSSSLYVASLNAAAEIVLAGSTPQLDRAIDAVRGMGARAERLKVSVPSHGPLLDAVSERLRVAVRGVRTGVPRVPYIGNCRARALRRPEEILEDLVSNVSRTVRWHDSVTLLCERGCRLFVEMPPGRVLSGLVRRVSCQARAIAAVDLDVAFLVQIAREHRAALTNQ